MIFRIGVVCLLLMGSGCATTTPRPITYLRAPNYSAEAVATTGQPLYSYETVGKVDLGFVGSQLTVIDSDIRWEILYSGFSQGTLRATYREFIHGMARSDFTQEATYDFTPGTPSTISFKGAQIEVLDANNNEIRYRVLRGFDGEQESAPVESPAK